MKKLRIITLLIGLVFFSESCKEKTESTSLTREVTFKKEGELQLMKTQNDSVIASLDIEIADDEYEIQTGLMYRKSMQDDRGMLFVFDDERPRSFYMKNTEFALDIIFLNSKNEVVSIQKNAKPLDHASLSSNAPASFVLEVNAGLSERWTLETGDKMSWKVME